MIAIGCDHGGYELKKEIIQYLESKNLAYKDIVANKAPGERSALCSDCFSAEATREHNDTNVMALGARVTGPGLAIKMVDIWLNTPFSGDERHIRRINMIEE